MDNKKNQGGFVMGITPFIRNIGHLPPAAKDIDKNGLQHTDGYELVDVDVKEAEDLTSEAQQEILSAEY